MSKGPTEQQKKEIHTTVQLLSMMFSENNIPLQVGSSALMLFTAHIVAHSKERTEDIIEMFRRCVVEARERAT